MHKGWQGIYIYIYIQVAWENSKETFSADDVCDRLEDFANGQCIVRDFNSRAGMEIMTVEFQSAQAAAAARKKGLKFYIHGVPVTVY